MKTKSKKTERIHSLDSLRAIMMLLGLVIHSALTYVVIDYGEVLKDPGATHISNDFMFFLIHTFRMPIFFLVSGFFGAMLFYERKPIDMIKNRVSRIVYPFIVFLILLWPIVISTFVYGKLIFSGSNNALKVIIGYLSNPLFFIPQMTLHLWFLYYLILITTATVLLAFIFKRLPNVSANISKSFSWTMQKPIVRILVFSFLTCIIYFILGKTTIETSLSFIPDISIFIYYFFFYIIGWVLLKSKHLLNSMIRLDWLSVILGCIIFTLYFLMQNILQKSISYKWLIIINSFTVWLFVFGITGLFIRYGNKHSSIMRYISDASYWVYLIHVPFTAIVPILILHWHVPSTIKFLTVLITTITISFITYHFFVRNSFIGKFLNGKKYTRKLSDIKKTEGLSQIPIVEKIKSIS